MRYLMSFAYDGSCFYGYQRQPNKKTVEGEIEKVLKEVNNGKHVDIVSSGRTVKVFMLISKWRILTLMLD